MPTYSYYTPINDKRERLPELQNPVWGLQPGETARQYEYFCVYRDLGTQRSIDRVCRETGRSRSLIGDLCQSRQWVMRAEAWDKHLAFQEEEAAYRKEFNKRMRRRQIRVKRAEALQQDAMTLLALAEIKPYQIIVNSQGEEVQVGLTPREARAYLRVVPMMLKVGMEAERQEDNLQDEINGRVGYDVKRVLDALQVQLRPDEFERVLGIISSLVVPQQ